MMRVERGIRRASDPDIFLSHSAKDKEIAARLATDLNFCGIDVWLDLWELQIGQVGKLYQVRSWTVSLTN